MKRWMDLIFVFMAAPLWVPLLGVVACIVWIWEGRPIFFSQERAGLNGQPFRMFKIRTMRPGTAPDAERLTRLGCFLRASSLDELPELFHVLTGTMSLVGPRPLPVRYLSRYSPEQARRHNVRPGITGWAQVNGRNWLDWETKFAYDVWYVDHISIQLDLKILFMTVLRVLVPQGISSATDATMTEFTGKESNHGT